MKKVLLLSIFALIANLAAGQGKVTNNYEPLKAKTNFWQQNNIKDKNSYRCDYRFEIRNDTVFIDKNTAMRILSEKKASGIRMLTCEHLNRIVFYMNEKKEVYKVEWARHNVLWTFDNGDPALND